MAASILLTRKEMFIGVIVLGKRREVIKLYWRERRMILKSRKKFKRKERDSLLL